MRLIIGSLLLVASAVAIGDEAQLKQWEKMDRCSSAAFIVVSIIEDTPDGLKQTLAVQGAINGLKNNSKLGEGTPTENEVRVPTTWSAGFLPECQGRTENEIMIGLSPSLLLRAHSGFLM